MKLLFKVFMLALLCAPLSSPVRAMPLPQEQNLLINPGFENPYNAQCCHTEPGYAPGTPISEVIIAQGWLAWWVEPDSSPAFPGYCDYNYVPPSCQPYHRPEYGMSFPYSERIRSGGNAQKYFTFYSTHLAGLYQQVTGVTPGQIYRFTIHAMTWSTSAEKGFTSAGQPSMGVQVGIDPNGGTDPFSANIVWSQAQNAFDVWTLLGVETDAKSSTITVFTRSWPALALQHNDVYLDDASLVAVGQAAFATSPPLSTAGPAPGFTFVAPTAAFVPSTPLPNGEVWYTVQPGDTLGGIAYRFDTTVDAIKQLNSLQSNLIKSNDKLLIKVVVLEPTATPEPPPTEPPTLAPTLPLSPTTTLAPVGLSADYGQLCVVAYNDANGNATNDSESTLPEVRVTLSVGNTPLDGYVTTGGEQTHCFPQLPPGTYTVSVAAPAGYTPTTASDATVELQAGNLVTLAFGLATVAEAPVIAPTTPGNPANTLLVVGMGFITLAMAGAGVAAFVLARKK